MKFLLVFFFLLGLTPCYGQGEREEVRWFGATSFPNPCRTDCTIRFHNMDAVRNAHSITRAVLMDITGKVLYDYLPELKRNGKARQADFPASLAHLQSGVYFIVTTQGGVSKVWKILKT